MLPGLAMARSMGDDVAATVGVFAFPEVKLLVHEALSYLCMRYGCLSLLVYMIP